MPIDDEASGANDRADNAWIRLPYEPGGVTGYSFEAETQLGGGSGNGFSGMALAAGERFDWQGYWAGVSDDGSGAAIAPGANPVFYGGSDNRIASGPQGPRGDRHRYRLDARPTGSRS